MEDKIKIVLRINTFFCTSYFTQLKYSDTHQVGTCISTNRETITCVNSDVSFFAVKRLQNF